MRLFIICLFFPVLLSCNKTDCTSNCGKIRISGRITDATSGKGIPGVPVKAVWRMNGLCFVCAGPDAGGTKTDRSGAFSFVITGDTTRFGEYCLQVQAFLPEEFINPDKEQKDVLQASFRNRDVAAMQEIEFSAYQKTLLKIKLKRAQNDQFTELILYSRYHHRYVNELALMAQPLFMEHTIETAAGTFTRLRVDKWNTYSLQSTFEDSVFCKAGVLNEVELIY